MSWQVRISVEVCDASGPETWVNIDHTETVIPAGNGDVEGTIYLTSATVKRLGEEIIKTAIEQLNQLVLAATEKSHE